MTWNHLACEECWAEQNPDRQPHRTVNAEPAPCCFCGLYTTSGIFVRRDPLTLGCQHEEETEPEIIRAKWAMDGAATLQEAAQKLVNKAKLLLELAEQGWELTQPVDDDYGFIEKREKK